MVNFFLSGNLIFVFKLFVGVLNYFDFYAFPFDTFVQNFSEKIDNCFSFNRYDVSLLSFYVGEVEAE